VTSSRFAGALEIATHSWVAEIARAVIDPGQVDVAERVEIRIIAVGVEPGIARAGERLRPDSGQHWICILDQHAVGAQAGGLHARKMPITIWRMSSEDVAPGPKASVWKRPYSGATTVS